MVIFKYIAYILCTKVQFVGTHSHVRKYVHSQDKTCFMGTLLNTLCLMMKLIIVRYTLVKSADYIKNFAHLG